MTMREVLIAARAKIVDEDAWVQGNYALSSDWKPCGPTSTKAVCFCSIGALCAVTKKGPQTIGFHDAYAALDGLVPQGQMIFDFNDNHTHAEVLALFDKAIAAA